MNLEIVLPQLLRGIQNLPEHCKIELLKNVELLPNELPDFCREVEGILDTNFDERVYDWMREKTSKDQMLELATLIQIADPGSDPEWIDRMNQAIVDQEGSTDCLRFEMPDYAQKSQIEALDFLKELRDLDLNHAFGREDLRTLQSNIDQYLKRVVQKKRYKAKFKVVQDKLIITFLDLPTHVYKDIQIHFQMPEASLCLSQLRP